MPSDRTNKDRVAGQPARRGPVSLCSACGVRPDQSRSSRLKQVKVNSLGYVPLSHFSAKKIAAILTEAWEVPPSQKAAAALRAAGFTADDLWQFGKTTTARLQPEQWRNNTYNDMKDYEIAKRYCEKREGL